VTPAGSGTVVQSIFEIELGRTGAIGLASTSDADGLGVSAFVAATDEEAPGVTAPRADGDAPGAPAGDSRGTRPTTTMTTRPAATSDPTGNADRMLVPRWIVWPAQAASLETGTAPSRARSRARSRDS
jgi:hypothetical protein